MKTLEQIKEQYKRKTLDGSYLYRLAKFIPENELKDFGLEINKESKASHVHIIMTRENILIELECDVEYGFEKALNKRGISALMMYEVIKMWNWILEDGLENFNDDNYAQYGLPLFKATAVKYGFKNPIGNDDGDECKYSDGYDYE